MREFTTKPKEPGPPVEFSIDGREMVFRNPGWTPIVLSTSNRAVDQARLWLDWLGAGLPDEDGEWILARLMDASDPFSLDDVTEIFLGMVEEVTGRPTEPPTVSLTSEETPDSTAGRHLEMSTP